MTCGDVLFVRAGDIWSIGFRYLLDGEPQPLPAGARLQVRDSRGTALLTLSHTAGLTVDAAAGTIQGLATGTETLPLAVDGKRTELRMALKVFDPANEPGTAETLVDRALVGLPQVVA